MPAFILLFFFFLVNVTMHHLCRHNLTHLFFMTIPSPRNFPTCYRIVATSLIEMHDGYLVLNPSRRLEII